MTYNKKLKRKNTKGRTIRKVIGGGGGIFEPQEFFFVIMIPCMKFYQALA